jgi:prefoldin alpha subunit
MEEEQKKLLQQKYLELQLIDQQAKQLQKQLQSLDEQLLELLSLQQSLDELKEMKIGTQILVPVGNGIFTKADLKDNKELIVNVGANTTVKKSIADTKNMLKNQEEEINNLKEKLTKELEKVVLTAQDLETNLNNLISQQRKE